MEWATSEVLPAQRSLPAELPSGGLNAGPYLLGTGSTQHFDWHKKVKPHQWEFGTNYGVKHKYTGVLSHEEAQNGVKGAPDKNTKLGDVHGAENSSSTWMASEDVYGLQEVRRTPITLRMSEALGDGVGLNEAGFEEMTYKDAREAEFRRSKPLAQDKNVLDDGRTAAFNPEVQYGKGQAPAILGGEGITQLPQNERRAVRIV